MPVWHEKTRALVEEGRLQIVAVALEQHPDRTRLYSAWKGYDFPLLWDPFGLSGLEVVPVITGVDEFGITRTAGLDVRRFDEEFLAGFMDAEFEDDAPAAARGSRLVEFAADAENAATPRAALGRLLDPRRRGDAGVTGDVDALAAWAARDDAPPEAHFFLGVALRMRFDGPHARPGDFQAALDAWRAALAARPGQYIWRRRIQQWGPRLDKPYAFYDWVDEAQRALAERGVEFPPLVAPLSGSEVAGRGAEAEAEANPEPPDPGGAIPRDDGALVSISSAAAPHTDDKTRAWRIHLDLTPAKGVEWTAEVPPPVLWIEDAGGLEVASRRIEFPPPADLHGVLRIDFGASVPDGAGAEPRTLRGYALYPVCIDGTGECVYRRQDVALELGG